MSADRIALVGCGRWGRHVLRDLVQLGCEVTVIDPHAEARDYALSHGAARVTDSLADVGPIDGVIIATPADSHAGVVRSALDLQVPVFCEKPLALTVEEASDLAGRGDGRLFVMDKWRYHPGVEGLRDLARSGEMGAVIGLRTTRIGWSPPQVDSDPVWTLVPHDLSIALEILGHLPEPRRAVAEFVDGRAVGLNAILGDDPWFVLEVGGFCPVERREIRLICGESVALLPDAYSDHLLLLSRGVDPAEAPERRTRSIAMDPPLLRELRAFVDFLGGGAPPRSSASDGALIASLVIKLREMAGIDDSSAGDDRDGRGTGH